MLNEMGTRLKEARIAKGYSLEDLQDVTKIQKRYLAGIEEGNYSMMPGQFYVRAFIKQYADAVGLNADELLEQHKSEMPETTKEQVSKPMAAPARSRRQSMSKSSSGRINEKMPMIIVALFIVLIIFVMWFFYNMLAENDPTDEAAENDDGLQYEAPSENSPPPTEEEEPAEDEAAEEQPEEEEPAEPETEISVTGTEGQTTTYQWTGPAERELVIDVSGPSWVGATDENGENLMTAATMQAGQSETLDVSEASQIRLRLGAAPNVELSLNGEPIEYQQDLTTQNIVIDFTDAE
ncbi:helix-turn-helix domain-containing protein [Planomicrobium okeanokoites]|uniref:helix-turn-helix domain-containing protein n=1 Tax=Planomicrobium okeanokoites TaxID=244 RepID=UPI00249119C5|nr:helix-turn-helix domain-containing protein [Planomicrobium okeanokoites]